jgi:hypothetical protein
MEKYEFGFGTWKLITKKKVKNWNTAEKNLHRRYGFGALEIIKKNGKPSYECYEPEMLDLIKNYINNL